MELTRTDAVFSRIVLGSYFCAEIKVFGKIWKNSRNYIFVEDPRIQKGTAGASHSPHTPPGRGPGLATPGAHLARRWLGWRHPFRLFTPFDLKTPEPSIVFPEKIQSAAATSKPNSGTKSSCSGTLLGRGLQGSLSPSPSPPPLHRPSMFPPSMCE